MHSLQLVNDDFSNKALHGKCERRDRDDVDIPAVGIRKECTNASELHFIKATCNVVGFPYKIYTFFSAVLFSPNLTLTRSLLIKLSKERKGSEVIQYELKDPPSQ